MKRRIPITTAGLYWILVLCGLVGTTILRRDHLDQLVPLWIGTVGGVTIGQLASKLRIRPLVPLLLIPATAWIILPFSFYFFAYSGMSSTAAEGLALAFVPSLLGGYLSLSERGGLVAFWYPVVLWMIVILDHPLDARQTAFHPQAALPFLTLLGALFVAFLRARETRRVTIWESHGSPRLALRPRRTVLRSSPIRSTLSVVWTGAVGGVALLLTWWVAPQLWQKDQQVQREAFAQTVAAARESALPCCESRYHRTRIHEYLPLGVTEESSTSCRSCAEAQTVAPIEHRPLYGAPTYSGGWSAGLGNEGQPNVQPTPASIGLGDPSTASPTTVSPTTTWTNVPTSPVLTPGSTQPVPGSVSPVARNAPAVATPKNGGPAGLPKTRDGVVPTTKPAALHAPGSTPTFSGAGYAAHPGNVDVEAQRPSSSPFPSSAPWPWMFAAAIAGVIAHVLLRMLRRTVTLAHLARPFWNEPIDQRISNHWQRMRIGLRDAGIQESRDESPSAFARRIGIEGMESCATILERVRHGVRIEEHDLANMASAAGVVFTKARDRAGLSGRAAAWLRWPLA